MLRKSKWERGKRSKGGNKTDFQKDRLFLDVYVDNQDKRLITKTNQLSKIHIEMKSRQRLTTKTNSVELY